ncbi:MAG: DNA repair protein RadC [Bacteroidota bacterium]|nr:DNA repair protein RadC [Bacteroidota bacterium]
MNQRRSDIQAQSEAIEPTQIYSPLSVDMRTYTNTQLLQLIIGPKSRDVLNSSNNSLIQLGHKNMYDLMKLKGIGMNKALRIMATIELGKRRHSEPIRDIQKISSSLEVFNYFYPLLADLPHEEFWIMCLRRNNSVIGAVQVSIGGVNGTVADPKQIFRLALEHRAVSIALCHNHPSGSTVASNQDITLTRKLIEGARLLEISIGDHVIIGGNKYYSFADDGLIY